MNTGASNFKDNITSLLKEKKISMAELAGFIEIPTEELCREMNSADPDLKTAERIARELRVPMFSLFRTPGYDSVADSAGRKSWYKIKHGEKIDLVDTMTREVKKQGINMSDFAEYIDVDVKELDPAVLLDRPRPRTIEQICKALQLPFYCIFFQLYENNIPGNSYIAI